MRHDKLAHICPNGVLDLLVRNDEADRSVVTPVVVTAALSRIAEILTDEIFQFVALLSLRF